MNDEISAIMWLTNNYGKGKVRQREGKEERKREVNDCCGRK